MKKWPHCKENIPKTKNVAHQALVEETEIFLPPLHIKLGLIIQFIKEMSKDREGFKYSMNRFPHIS